MLACLPGRGGTGLDVDRVQPRRDGALRDLGERRPMERPEIHRADEIQRRYAKAVMANLQLLEVEILLDGGSERQGRRRSFCFALGGWINAERDLREHLGRPLARLIDIDLGGVPDLLFPLLTAEAILDEERAPDRAACVSTGKKTEALERRIPISGSPATVFRSKLITAIAPSPHWLWNHWRNKSAPLGGPRMIPPVNYI